MHTLYEDAECETVAGAGVAAGCAFDSGSKLPCEMHVVDLA